MIIMTIIISNLQPITFLLLISTVTFTFSSQIPNCQNTCGTGEDKESVQYPFGFSSGCPIRLDCNSTTATIKIGEFSVLNVTSDGIILDLPPNCNRSLNSIKSLFSSNYGLSWENSLLLQNCQNSLSCVIPTSLVTSRFASQSCYSNMSNNISCFSQEVNHGIDVLSYESVKRTNCTVLFSSIDVGSSESGNSLEFQRIKLVWWVNGSCIAANGCDRNANCSGVQLANRNGYRCLCNSGFEGDGFAAGDGCRKVSDCNAANYFAERCRGNTRGGALAGGLVAGAAVMTILALACYFCRRRATLKTGLIAKHLISEAAKTSNVPFYDYKEIERATDNFSDKQMLGTGAYGTVYAGKLQNEWLAIKIFRHKDRDHVNQVMNEIKLISSVSHPNLVRLLGCCVEKGEPILIYEFMPNGTLSQHLQKEKGTGIKWTIRLAIANETANAIAYLHSSNPPVYHRDIKSSNILLDYNYSSKVADFGLSRLGMTESSMVSTTPQGTPGYLDPEYHQYFHLSDKSDVYSFGVVLVEIITALKVVDFSRIHSEVNLAALAVDRIRRGCVDEIIDPYLEPDMNPRNRSSVHGVAELAFRCLSYHKDMRPTMKEVVEELQNICAPIMKEVAECSFSDQGNDTSLTGGELRSSLSTSCLLSNETR